MHYIHQNPLRAGLVSRMDDWVFSSFRDYSRLRNGTLCNKETAFLSTGINEKDFAKESYEVMVDIPEITV